MDFSIKSTMEEAETVNRKIMEFCKENGLSGKKANLAAICAEEMTVNIIKFGGKTSNWIDINLCLENDVCRLRTLWNTAMTVRILIFMELSW